MKLCPLILGGVCLAAVVGLYMLLEIQQKAFHNKVRLYDYGKILCKDDQTVSQLANNGDFTAGCYSFQSNLEISNNVCSDNIFSESMCGTCMKMSQKVEKYRHRVVTKRVCSRKGRSGDTIREEFTDSDNSPAAVAARNNNNCHDVNEDVYEWKDTDWTGSGWNFPLDDNNNPEFGMKTLQNAPENVNFVDLSSSDKIQFASAGDASDSKIIRKRTIQKLGTVPMPIWNQTFYSDPNLEASRDPNSLCISQNEAHTHWDTDGLTNSEFQSLANFGNILHYPSCQSTYPTMAIGNYRVSATCSGKEVQNTRIVALVEKINGTLHSGGFTDSAYSSMGDDAKYTMDELKPFIFIMREDSTDMAGAFDLEIRDMQMQFANTRKFFNGAMAVLGVVGILFLVWSAKNDGSSSSSSSSS